MVLFPPHFFLLILPSLGTNDGHDTGPLFPSFVGFCNCPPKSVGCTLTPQVFVTPPIPSNLLILSSLTFCFHNAHGPVVYIAFPLKLSPRFLHSDSTLPGPRAHAAYCSGSRPVFGRSALDSPSPFCHLGLRAVLFFSIFAD